MKQKQHLTDFHLVEDDYNGIITSYNDLLERKQQQSIRKASYIPGFLENGIGGIITATMFNYAATNIANNMVKNTMVSLAERQSIFSQLSTEVIYDHVRTDYFRVFLSLCWILKQNGKEMWYPDSDEVNKGQSIFSNLSNPIFSSDRIPHAMLQVLRTDPYNMEYYDFLTQYYGERKDVTTIREYFIGF